MLNLIKSSLKVEHISQGTHQFGISMTHAESAKQFSTLASLLSDHKFDHLVVGDYVPYTNRRDGMTKYSGNFEAISRAFVFVVITDSQLDKKLKTIIHSNDMNILGSRRDKFLSSMPTFLYGRYLPTEDFIRRLLSEVDVTVSIEDLLGIWKLDKPLPNGSTSMKDGREKLAKLLSKETN